MAASSLAPRLTDILEAIGHIRSEMAGVTIDAFEADWRKRWLVERGVEIISEASRHLSDELKARHPQIPWPKVAGIGNILRHEYEGVAPPVMWKLAQEDLDSIGAGLSRGAGKGAGGRRIAKVVKENPLWPSTLATADERGSETDKGMPLGSR